MPGAGFAPARVLLRVSHRFPKPARLLVPPPRRKKRPAGDCADYSAVPGWRVLTFWWAAGQSKERTGGRASKHDSILLSETTKLLQESAGSRAGLLAQSRPLSNSAIHHFFRVHFYFLILLMPVLAWRGGLHLAAIAVLCRSRFPSFSFRLGRSADPRIP